MGYLDRKGDEARATIEAQVPEPVIAVGGLQPAGTWGSFGLTELSPALGMFKQRRANQKAGSLSTRGVMFKGNRQTWFAITADKLYAIETKYGYGGMKVLGTLAVWNRADLRVQTIPGKMATKVVIDHADGGHYELEANTALARGYNDELLSELVRPAAS